MHAPRTKYTSHSASAHTEGGSGQNVASVTASPSHGTTGSETLSASGEGRGVVSNGGASQHGGSTGDPVSVLQLESTPSFRSRAGGASVSLHETHIANERASIRPAAALMNVHSDTRRSSRRCGPKGGAVRCPESHDVTPFTSGVGLRIARRLRAGRRWRRASVREGHGLSARPRVCVSAERGVSRDGDVRSSPRTMHASRVDGLRL